MREVFRKRKRSDETYKDEEIKHKMSVWLPGSDGREQHVCLISNDGIRIFVPIERYLKLKKERAEENRKIPPRRPRPKKRLERHSLAW